MRSPEFVFITFVKDQEVSKKAQQCVEELARCIFVQSVEAPTLAETTVLVRGLNERNEQTKRHIPCKSDERGQASGV